MLTSHYDKTFKIRVYFLKYIFFVNLNSIGDNCPGLGQYM